MSFRSKLSRLDGGRLAPAVAEPTPALLGRAPAVDPAAEKARLLDDLRARIQATLERTAQRVPAPPPPVDLAELPFALEATPAGLLCVRSERLSAAHRTGRIGLAGAGEASPELLALLALDPSLARCDLRRALFLDTETTGLAGGTGTLAFLVGLAWLEQGSFVLEQLLVRTPGEERPVLERVAERLRGASMLVTFNGKTFDMPLLRTRFVLARLPAPEVPPHLDLLHVARRIHRSGPARRLVSIERHVLGFERADDVESRDVAACYFHFLRTGDARALLGVVEHNAWDVLAMAALVALYGEPTHERLGPSDLVGVARTLRRAGAIDRAWAAAEAAVEREAAPESVRARAEIAKARGDRARALADFESLAQAVDDPAARLELAKLYEHWLKEPSRALAWVEKGTGETEAGVKKRAERLARKAQRNAGRKGVVGP